VVNTLPGESPQDPFHGNTKFALTEMLSNRPVSSVCE
jgi:hypothetical protein